jgi:xylan 1,4-beta-xylosidase
MSIIRNPILPGFHPDPSICRVGEDFYLANSTFEWWPGVRLHHSRDLVNWRCLGGALTRTSQLDMRGNPDSGGIWAPCLSYADGLFWLIYTDVKSLNGAYKDTPNYLVTAERIEGPWSEPAFLNAGGFDPSLFHDTDGRKWLVNMVWDHRPSRNRFGGIVLQQYDPQQQRLVGPIRTICQGTNLGCTEGPHLYKRQGWYYLMLAEGGTGYDHAVTVVRSRNIVGPYEVDPTNPILTSKDKPHLELQKAGHASLVDTPSGEWYMVHLCSRPLPIGGGRSVLGRETAIQKMNWTLDGWLRLQGGGSDPKVDVPAPRLPEQPWPKESIRDDFDQAELSVNLNTLRVSPDSGSYNAPARPPWLSLTERPGYLRLRGRHSLASRHEQSLVGRRVQDIGSRCATSVEFDPECFQQSAGLAAYYNTQNWYYLCITADDRFGRRLALFSCDNGKLTEHTTAAVALHDRREVQLRAVLDRGMLQFYYMGACGGSTGRSCRWLPVGPDFDGTTLSDEYVEGWGFTGAFFALVCQDLTGQMLHADFDWFEYAWLTGPPNEQ